MSYPTEYLTVNGLDLPTSPDDGDIWLGSMAPFRATADRRGERVPMPYRKGGIIYAHRDTITELVPVLYIAGATWALQDDNEIIARTSLVGTHAADGSVLPVSAVWHRNNGQNWTAQVLVLGLYEPELDSEAPPTMRYNMPLVVEGGWFAAP